MENHCVEPDADVAWDPCWDTDWDRGCIARWRKGNVEALELPFIPLLAVRAQGRRGRGHEVDVPSVGGDCLVGTEGNARGDDTSEECKGILNPIIDTGSMAPVPTSGT